MSNPLDPLNDKMTTPADIDVKAVAADNDVGHVVDWTDAEERQKWVIMPLMIAGFYSLQLDRGNIANAITGTLLADVGITQDEFNNGQTILLLMIVLFEIPSNIILTRVGAKWWLSSQILVWSIIASAQCMIRSPGAFYATRCLLGIAESGFIPGGVYYLSTMFTRAELSSSIAWFYAGNICGKGSSGLLAAAILPLQGKGGLPGWSWIFLIEGLIGIVIAIACFIFLPVDCLHNKSLIGVNVWTDRRAHILHTRVVIDDPHKEDPIAHFKPRNIVFALTRWRMWIHVVFCILGIACNQAVNTYNPQIVRSLGFPNTTANAMSSVGAWLQLPLVLGWGYAMDRSRWKGPLITLVTGIILVLDGVYFSFVSSGNPNRWARYAVMQLIVAFGQPFYTAGLAWATASARLPNQRSMYAALYIMASNSGQAIGGQMFRGDDAPLYIKGFTAAMCLYAVCFVLTLVLTFIYAYSNRKSLGDAGEEIGAAVQDDDGVNTKVVVFRYPS